MKICNILVKAINPRPSKDYDNALREHQHALMERDVPFPKKFHIKDYEEDAARQQNLLSLLGFMFSTPEAAYCCMHKKAWNLIISVLHNWYHPTEEQISTVERCIFFILEQPGFAASWEAANLYMAWVQDPFSWNRIEGLRVMYHIVDMGGDKLCFEVREDEDELKSAVPDDVVEV